MRLCGCLLSHQVKRAEQVTRSLAGCNEGVQPRIRTKPLSVRPQIGKLQMRLVLGHSRPSPGPHEFEDVRAAALKVAAPLLDVNRYADFQKASEASTNDIRTVGEPDLSDEARSGNAKRRQGSFVDRVGHFLRFSAVSELGAASIARAVEFKLVVEKLAAVALVNSHTKTYREHFVGSSVWTAFPANPRVPLIFPIETGKHRAGVAELVDALVLGTGQSALQINSLRSPSHWIVGANVRAGSNPVKASPSPPPPRAARLRQLQLEARV